VSVFVLSSAAAALVDCARCTSRGLQQTGACRCPRPPTRLASCPCRHQKAGTWWVTHRPRLCLVSTLEHRLRRTRTRRGQRYHKGRRLRVKSCARVPASRSAASVREPQDGLSATNKTRCPGAGQGHCTALSAWPCPPAGSMAVVQLHRVQARGREGNGVTGTHRPRISAWPGRACTCASATGPAKSWGHRCPTAWLQPCVTLLCVLDVWTWGRAYRSDAPIIAASEADPALSEPSV